MFYLLLIQDARTAVTDQLSIIRKTVMEHMSATDRVSAAHAITTALRLGIPGTRVRTRFGPGRTRHVRLHDNMLEVRGVLQRCQVWACILCSVLSAKCVHTFKELALPCASFCGEITLVAYTACVPRLRQPRSFLLSQLRKIQLFHRPLLPSCSDLLPSLFT